MKQLIAFIIFLLSSPLISHAQTKYFEKDFQWQPLGNHNATSVLEYPA